MSANLFGEDKNTAPIVPETFTHEENVDFFEKRFAEVRKYLMNNSTYNSIDDPLLRVYAQALTDIRRYDAVLAISGDLMLGVKGRLEDHPYIRLKHKAIDNARNIAASLGILSMNRKKLDSTTDTEIADSFADFFTKKD